MSDECRTEKIEVIIQENGIIRRAVDGLIIGRISEDFETMGGDER